MVAAVALVEGVVLARVFLVEDAHVVEVAGVLGLDAREEVVGVVVHLVQDAG